MPELKDFENKILSAKEKIEQLEYYIFNNLREQIRAKNTGDTRKPRVRWPISTCWLRWQKLRLNTTILSRN